MGEVLGQIGQMHVARIDIESLRRLGNRVMQRAPLARQQIRLDGLTGQRMAKGKHVGRLLDHQLRVDQLLDSLHQSLGHTSVWQLFASFWLICTRK